MSDPYRSPQAKRAVSSASASRAARTALPPVSMPKGGGAIRGMGEKFSVNAASGSAAMSIPIDVTHARGFEPQLRLSYDSGAGNGPFGFGWSLSLPAITRKTDKGLPRYSEDDTFLIAGAEDLVPVLETGVPLQRSRTVHGVLYDLRFYRPRIEGLFARIERWTARASGIAHWRAITRENVTTLYGFDSRSRVFDPDDEKRTFSWSISRSWDDKGNVVLYDYLREDSRDINEPHAHEAHRTPGSRSANHYLKSVRYGNATPYFPTWAAGGTAIALPASFHFELVLDYGDHDDAVPLASPSRDWKRRPDPFSSYRAGFEVRTYRRCARILLFHHFAAEAGIGDDCLVRSTDLLYSDQNIPIDSRNPVYTFVDSIQQVGYRRDGDGYLRRTLPPLELEYAKPVVHPEVLTLDRGSLAGMPEGVDGSRYQWVDLDGEGMSGILTDHESAWAYKRNLAPLNEVLAGDGTRIARAKFGPLESVAALPSRSDLPESQFLDLAGDGRIDLVTFKEPVPGFFERTAHEQWEAFRPFEALPRVNWEEPNLKFVDLTGDGHADVLITEEGAFTFYPSLGEGGFGEAQRVPVPWDETHGPSIVFADGTQTIHLADMSGDGLPDLVRIRNGDVSYWPNLGYGRFGAKVTMDAAPRFDDDEAFEPRRIRLGDIDGSGTTDILYAGSGGVVVAFNRSGNSWAEPQRLAVFPGDDALSSVQVVDLLGNGTACLVWSSPLPGQVLAPLRYVDLMGGRKPHLLTRLRNNLGAETRMRYAPSTRFFLADRLAGRPWITRLPFPVQVVEQVEVYDWIGRSRFATRYVYHHGYFDGEEREMRGFGMVEQWDTAIHREDTLFPDASPANESDASFVPPVCTKTWFHTGAYVEAGTVSRQYASEYWVEPALRGDALPDIAAREAMLLPDTVLPPDLSPDETREAYRALKGSILRTETYAADGTPRGEHPYVITERNYTIRREQARGPNRHAVFFTHPREAVSCQYERQPDDPRVSHELTLDVGDFGEVKRAVTITYPRRGAHDPEPTLPAAYRTMLAYDQSRLHAHATERVYTNRINDPAEPTLFDAYRGHLPSETITAELTGVAAPAARFSFSDVEALWSARWDGAHDVPYENVTKADIDGAGPPAPVGRRVVERTRMLYRRDNLDGLLAPGTLEPLALPGDSYQLAFTPGLLSRVFGSRVTDAILIEGGYFRFTSESDWWILAERIFYSAIDGDTAANELTEAKAHFFAPRRAIDPFEAISRVAYDAYDLRARTTIDALGNTTTADHDYRLLEPVRVTDPNGNRAEAAYDALGELAGSALIGKAGEGDSLAGFVADLPDAAIDAFRADPIASAAALLGNATTRIINDDLAYFRTRHLPEPDAPMVCTIARETHVSDLVAGETSPLHHTFVYWDGFGREAQQKTLAEPGPVPGAGPNVSPRWAGSGWAIYNNKGNTIRRFQPFFSDTHHFEFDAAVGTSTLFFYDPMDRIVATFHPDDTFEKTVIEAWRQETWDRNDTVAIADPRDDPHAGAWFERLLGNAPFISWHDRRIGGAFGATAEERDANKDAATKAHAHRETPAVSHHDALGRACLAVNDNGTERHPSRIALDPENLPLCVFDAPARHVMEMCVREPSDGGFRYVAGYDIAGRPIHRNGMDGDERFILSDVVGLPIRTWNGRGHAFRMRYDALRRLTHRFAESGGTEVLLERLVYGEKHPDAARNLKGQLFRHYDTAGVAGHDRYDFKANVRETSRQFARAYRGVPNWAPLNAIADDPLLDLAALDAASAPLLIAADSFTAVTRFNAADQAAQVVTPHASGGRPSVLQPRYNEAGLLERVDVWIRRASAPAAMLDPATADLHAIVDIDYDAQGRHVRLEQGNDAITTYEYDAPSMRLSSLRTTRPHADADARVVQDLAYTYDPVGNITRIRDSADIQNVVFFANQRVDPTGDYTYDPTYRLTIAAGREHLGHTGGVLHAPLLATHDDSPRTHMTPVTRQINPGDGRAIGRYSEKYTYDSSGNILKMVHDVASGSWTRHYAYDEASRITAAEKSNRLSATSIPGDVEGGPYGATYEHDEHGNMTRMPHLSVMTWDARDRLQSTARQSAGAGTPETTYYSYDADTDRLRKTTDHFAAAGVEPRRKSERLYLGLIEIYREFDAGGAVTLERETLHVSDNDRRVAIIETRTAGSDPAPARMIRYQFTNHLGTASLELDDTAAVVSYEEYFPFGGTAYQAVRSNTETPKRYRYTGKERDEENDLYYYGARYYAPWLGRWTACDPGGDGANLYVYVANRPIIANDPNGKWWNILVGAVIGAVVGGGIELGRQLINRRPGESLNWGRIGAATGGGLVGGAIAGATMGGNLLAQAGVVALGATVGGTVTRSLNREPTTAGDVAMDVIVGLATFGLLRGAGAALGRVRGGAGGSARAPGGGGARGSGGRGSRGRGAQGATRARPTTRLDGSPGRLNPPPGFQGSFGEFGHRMQWGNKRLAPGEAARRARAVSDETLRETGMTREAAEQMLREHIALRNNPVSRGGPPRTADRPTGNFTIDGRIEFLEEMVRRLGGNPNPSAAAPAATPRTGAVPEGPAPPPEAPPPGPAPTGPRARTVPWDVSISAGAGSNSHSDRPTPPSRQGVLIFEW